MSFAKSEDCFITLSIESGNANGNLALNGLLSNKRLNNTSSFTPKFATSAFAICFTGVKTAGLSK